MQDFEIQKTARAKRVSLKIKPCGQLVVIVPNSYNIKKIPQIIELNALWIENIRHKVLSRHDRAMEDLSEAEIQELTAISPEIISLRAIDEYWKIEYRPTTSKKVSLKEDFAHKIIILHGNIDDLSQCVVQLKSWLRKRAENELISRLDEMSDAIDISYANAFVKNQKSRWGSCSSKGNINLNQKLLFVPQELLEYILIHELCHIKHLNHSRDFWSLVQDFAPSYKDLDRLAKTVAWLQYIPKWCE